MSRSYEAAKQHPEYIKQYNEGYRSYPKPLPFPRFSMLTWDQIAFRDGWDARAELDENADWP